MKTDGRWCKEGCAYFIKNVQGQVPKCDLRKKKEKISYYPHHKKFKRTAYCSAIGG